MGIVPILIIFPFLIALLIPLVEKRTRDITVYLGAGGVMLLTAVLLVSWAQSGTWAIEMFYETGILDHVMMLGEIFLMCLIVFMSFRYRKYPVALLSVVQTALVIWTENQADMKEAAHMQADGLAMVMCLIIAVIGGFICIYAVGYMKGYHKHHKECKDRSGFFLSMLFVFLGAMFGLVLSANLIWMYFFWEITSVISFLLIGYTKTEEAIHNSFTALWMNLLGGLAFAAGIAVLAFQTGSVQLSDLVSGGNTIALACLAVAALTKSAQMPFSGWLLGAMVAPTPSSALLHSATMVKAGVYLLIRMAPVMSGTMTGTMVSIIGGFTFISASMMAIAQSDAKRVLAFSTISNLGLIVACAGIGMDETVWGAIFLMIFHAVSKSMLFQSVGAVENSIGSRNIEDMHGLILKMPKLAYVMGIGIAGMYLAPFGMLISKWVVLRAFVDSRNILLVIFLAFGSATTMLYWTKWLSKLIALHRSRDKVEDVTKAGEYLSMYVHAALMLLLCVLLPVMASHVINPITGHLFGGNHPVLSMGVLTTMAIMLVSVIGVPAIMFLVTRRAKKDYVPIYMSGINAGDNRYFINSMGEEEHLYITNWYLRHTFGRRRLMNPSLIFSAGWLIVMLCLIIGGAL
ncbi:MAG: NADH-quinone oxidoreductase subunit L [Ruminococcus sp.]